jgi:hypothetical protein
MRFLRHALSRKRVVAQSADPATARRLIYQAPACKIERGAQSGEVETGSPQDCAANEKLCR